MSMTLIRVTDLIYRNSDEHGVLVIVSGRARNDNPEEQDKRVACHITGTTPYAFVPDHDRVDLDIGGHVDLTNEIPDEDWVVHVENGYQGYDGVPLRRVEVAEPSNVNDLKEEFETVYEADVPYVRRSSIDYGLSGYIRVPEEKVTEIGDTEIRAENAPRVSVDELETEIDSGEVAEQIEPRILMADIEVIPPGEGGSFDQFVENANKAITAITTYDTYAEEYCAFVLDPEDVVEGAKVKQHLEDHWSSENLAGEYVEDADIRLIKSTTEKDMLLSFIDTVEDYRPDLLSGWNWVDFDHEYLLNRFRNNFDNINEHRLSDIGTVNGFKVAEKIDGLPGFDMMQSFCEKMTFSQWRSKSLDFVAKEELEIGKVEDVSIGEAYQSERNRFLAYNIIDTQLLVGMDEKHGIHEFFYELADLSSIQIYDCFSEMRLVDGFLMAHRDDDEILPTQSKKDLESIPGGLVLSPSDGVEEWVAVLDLKSLYPSIFITLNVSEETLTKNPEFADLVCPDMPANEDDVGGTIEDHHIKWDVEEGAVGMRTDRPGVNEGVLPKYLALLFEERADKKEVRNQYDPDDPRYTVWDNKQNAVKVIMNSFYGVSQNRYYRLSTPIEGSQGIGSTITAGGRYTLWRGAEIAEKMGYDVKYGDSVPATEPVLIRDEHGIDIVEISNVESRGFVEVWSDYGWTPIRDVIKKPNEKKMYRTRTKNGVVNTTEDHALLDSEKNEISPENVSPGDTLCHYNIGRAIPEFGSGSIDPERAWLLGLFVADGNAAIYGQESDIKRSWKITNEDRTTLERARDAVGNHYGLGTIVNDHRGSTGAYQLQPSFNDEGRVRRVVELFRDKCYTQSGEKRIPRCVLNSEDDSVVEAFLIGYHNGDGYVGDNYVKEFHEVDTRSPVLAHGVVYLLQRLGFEFNVNTRIVEREDEQSIYYKIRKQKWHHDDPEKVTDIETVPYDGEYVYDLETENHHFAAGVGNIVVHNTDSIMISLADADEDVTAREVVERGKEVEEEINAAMDDVADEFGVPEEHPFLKDKNLHGTDRHCLHWEFEKLYRRFLQTGTKKRYAGLKAWSEGKWLVDPDAENPDYPKPDITGLEANRADVPPITAETQKKVIEMVLAGAEFEEVSEYVAGVVQTVKNHEKELSELGTPGVINKPLEEYPNRPTKRACLYSNEHLGYGFREGDDPWIYKIEDTPPMKPATDVIALEWGDEALPEGYGLDIEGIIEKKIQDPIDPVIPWTFEELRSGRQVEAIDLGGGGGSSDNPFASASTSDETADTDTDREDNKRVDETHLLDSEYDESDDEEESDGKQSNNPLEW